MILSIRDWQKKLHAAARAKGWWESVTQHGERFLMTPDEILSRLMLITTEVAEAAECVRNRQMEPRGGELIEVPECAATIDGRWVLTKPEGIASELADIVIRCLDLAGALGIDLEAAIELKARYNETRSYRHGAKAA